MAPDEKKPAVLHRSKLFNGQSAEDVHRSHFPGNARCKCGSRQVVVQARSFIPVADLIRDNPQLAMQLAAQNMGQLPVVDFRHGKHVRIGSVFACRDCKTDLERALARAPSYVVVEIDRGPGPDAPVVQVG